MRGARLPCSSSEKTSTASPSPSPRPSPTPIAVVTPGCAQTPALEGGRPDWLEAAGAHNNPKSVPYAIAKPAIAAGFLFGYPLRSGNPQDPANKILWVVGMPRNGSP
ncbi:MAG TPA: hypothetical protein VJR46_02475 [Candidatus Dormibacteraeota bacterium]|nr:hypothetical protein [Candidatus Dormibacteraeota bacterium]